MDTHLFVDLAAGKDISFVEEYRTKQLCVSAISSAEIACLVKGKRIEMSAPPDEWFVMAAKATRSKVLNLGAVVLARAMMFEWSHKDPADRILVQTIRDNADIELHTRDKKIIDYSEEWNLRCRDCRK